MGTFTMKIEVSAQRLTREVQEEFNRAYPFLRIEFIKRVAGARRFALSKAPVQSALEDSKEEHAENERGGAEKEGVEKERAEKGGAENAFGERGGERRLDENRLDENGLDENARMAAKALLWNTFGVSDSMSINELEILLQYQFGLPVQILRKSGNLWMETRMNHLWTLRQQNDHGEALSI